MIEMPAAEQANHTWVRGALDAGWLQEQKCWRHAHGPLLAPCRLVKDFKLALHDPAAAASLPYGITPEQVSRCRAARWNGCVAGAQCLTACCRRLQLFCAVHLHRPWLTSSAS